MTRTFYAAAAALMTLASPALAEEHSFKQDGVTYVYTVTPRKDFRIIQGSTSDGSEFRFTVRGERVEGDVDGHQISFRTPKADKVVIAER